MKTHQHRSGHWTITYHIYSFIGRDKLHTLGIRSTSSKRVPQRLMLTLAQKYDLKVLTETILMKCAAKLSTGIEDIDTVKSWFIVARLNGERG